MASFAFLKKRSSPFLLLLLHHHHHHHRHPRPRLPGSPSSSFFSSLPRCWEPPSFHDSLVSGLSKLSPGFPLHGSNVHVLSSPSQFYQTLKDCARASRDRVFLSSLYIGTGALEQDLLDVVAENLSENASLRVLLLFDALRSTRKMRPESKPATTPVFKSSSDMLASMLLADSAKWKQSRRTFDHKDQVRITLYRTPDLTKGLEKILPSRLNEVIGVNHMKIYVFDDNVLMSGANLSSSYFTNRQDRYILLRGCQSLADHFCMLIERVASFSYLLDKEGGLQRNTMNIDPRTKPTHFRQEMFKAMQSMLGDNVNICSSVVNTTGLVDHQAGLPDHQSRLVDHNGGVLLHGRTAYDTWVFPTLQMGSLGVFQDETCFLWLLANLPSGSTVHFASAYFNLTKEFQAALLESSTDKVFRILTAAPQANGFYGSRGVSGLIPKAYSMLEKDFYEQTCKKGSDLKSSLTYTNGEEDVRVATKQRCGIRLYEYQRHGWTFHAKGLWCYNQNEALPYMTLIGSSNFGYRSKQRDLEAQLFLTTLDPALRAKLKEETDLLFLHGRRVRHAHFLDRSRSGGPMSLFAAQLVRSWL